MPGDADRPGKGRTGRYRKNRFPDYHFGVIDLEPDLPSVHGHHHDEIPDGSRTLSQVQQSPQVQHRNDAPVHGGDASYGGLTGRDRVHWTDLDHLDHMRQLEPDATTPGTHQQKTPTGAAHRRFILPSSVAIRPAISVTGRT